MERFLQYIAYSGYAMARNDNFHISECGRNLCFNFSVGGTQLSLAVQAGMERLTPIEVVFSGSIVMS